MRIGIIRTVGSPCRCAETVIKGLQVLGHEYLLADSEEIELRVSEIVRQCDLIIDHTDTFHGRGSFRSLVRLLLETHGARVVGSDAKTCLLADDKIAAKAKLANGGIPVPPGIVACSEPWELPPWLTPPLVLKPAFEHMSRGLRLARTADEAYAAVSSLLKSLGQPVLIEQYIPGRELAVSLLEGPGGLELLPPLEWHLDGAGDGVLSEAFKLTEPAGERREALRAGLTEDQEKELKALAGRAFVSLGLRDYGRFDIRLSSGGTFFFLEANTTPSLEPFEALALSAQWAGLDYPRLVERMLSAALQRAPTRSREETKRIVIELPSGPVELEVPDGIHNPPASTIDMARLLDVKPGEDVLELGSGAGLLSIAAAKLGARSVTATDIDPKALESTLSNARRNGVGDRMTVRAGSWYETLRDNGGGQAGPFDLIIATPPQTPGPRPFGPRYGGFDGTKHLFTVVDGASAFLKPGGRLWLLAISLANASSLLKRLKETYSSVSILKETDRPFTAAEYDAMGKGLFDHFLTLRASGCSHFREAGPGRYAFRNLVIRAEKEGFK